MTSFVAPEWDSSALVVIDVQTEFVSGAMTVPGTADRIPALSRLVSAFRKAGRPIVHVVRLYVPGGTDTDLPRRAEILAGREVAAPGSDGSQIPAELLPAGAQLDPELLLAGGFQEVGPAEHIAFKPRWSAFYRTELERHLRERGISTVVVAGCNLPNCPRATLFDASERDYRAVIVEDATSQVTPERLHDLTLIGVTVTDVASVEKELLGSGESVDLG
ncbi:cysteine hydrolase family protein [Mycobacteroides franklinii]|uniref:Cysteine hydrolase n=1 Tax=Mycobacteroides franklinii TaxID=948102 RepID=A0A4R5P9X8_9MYCO|nr:isochorismatase family cysteine hydrolase [Mycobacteroides franklinii]ORA59749.1 cysteine hydrolase [Mycobacteroides franklinii]TDH20971.1 cysteine hydrolase [Mycobacteroides franklinii]